MNRMLLLLIVLTSLASLAFTQDKTLDRQYVPIIISDNNSTGLTGLVKEELTVFSYNAASETWTEIPFQIDQVKDNGGYEHVSPAAEIGNDDQILFMPSDVGDRAPQSAWAFMTSDTNEVRLEVECVDPLDDTKKGWIYLFQNAATPAGFENYLTYIPSPNPSTVPADTIVSPYYTMGHSQNSSIFDDLAFPSNPDLDLLDRLKIRVKGEPLGDELSINENSIDPNTEGGGPVSAYRGEVRLFRDARIIINTGYFLYSSFKVPFNLVYYPYSISGALEIKDLSQSTISLLNIKLIRLSLDMASDAEGMKFYCDEFTDGYPVDGVQDGLDYANISNFDEPKWMMVTGEQGTVFMMLKWPKVENGDSKIFQWDNLDGIPPDNLDATGDGQSWCDMGLWSRVNGNDGLIANEFSFAWSLYFIDKDVNENAAEFAASLKAQSLNPVTVTVTEQNYQFPTSIADNAMQPTGFALHQAYPNPYRAGDGQVRFEFTSPNRHNNMDLVIYNVLGQQVRRFNHIQASANTRNAVNWNGLDDSGRQVSPGIYFYRLNSSTQQLHGKLLIIQ